MVASAEIADIALQIGRNADATDRLVAVQRRKFTWAYGLVVLTIVAVAALGFYVHRRSDEALDKANLALAQTQCYNTVQGNYVEQIGLLADSNGASLRGEPINVQANRDRVVALRKASRFVASLQQICYTDNPDPTPLDGVLPDGTMIPVQ